MDEDAKEPSDADGESSAPSASMRINYALDEVASKLGALRTLLAKRCDSAMRRLLVMNH